jgi:hypothetical protein
MKRHRRWHTRLGGAGLRPRPSEHCSTVPLVTLPALFSGPPPNRSTFIGGHWVEFSPEHWLDRLPERWMFDRLADIPVLEGNRWPRITRRYLFDLADKIGSPEEAVQFYVAVCAWGAGKKARLVGRRVRVLRESQDAGVRLLAGIRLAEDSPVGAYTGWRTGGEHRLLHLGPAFFTKVIYFAGWPEHEPDRIPKPLILDQYVAAAFNQVTDMTWPRTWNWTPLYYEHYIYQALMWAAEWGCEPDVIERTLFEHGKTL